MIVVGEPLIGELEEKLVLEALRSGRLVQGPMVDAFEAAVRDVVGTRHALAVNSGTSALIAALMANGIGAGDEVITSPFTFVATLNAILFVGATPRFVDLGDDFAIDPSLVAEAITHTTRAVMPVHLYGCPADMATLEAVIGDREIAVVEDAAQALGAAVGGRSVGTFGTACFSFYATKNVTTGEGGVVTTDDDDVAEAVRLLRNQGQRATYDYARPGFNFRLTELQAALGVAQMQRLPDITAARRSNAAFLNSSLVGLPGVVLPQEPVGRRHVFHQYTIRVTHDARLGRDELRACLLERGISCGVYYPAPVFEHECFRMDPRVGRPDLPVTERAAREVLSLPVHPNLTDSDLDRVATAMWEVLA